MAKPKPKLSPDQFKTLLEIEAARWAKPAVDEDVGKAVLSDEMADMGVKPASASVAEANKAVYSSPAAHQEVSHVARVNNFQRQSKAGGLTHMLDDGSVVTEPASLGLQPWKDPSKSGKNIAHERSYWRAVEDPDVLPMSQGAPAHISTPVETEETPLRQQLRLMAKGVDSRFPGPSTDDALIQKLAGVMGVSPEKLQSMIAQIRKRSPSVEQELDAQLDPLNFGGSSTFKGRR